MTQKQTLGPNQTRWLADLRSGKYQQGKGCLRSHADRYCCLGVACETLGLTVADNPHNFSFRRYGEERAHEVAPTEVIEQLKLHGNNGQTRTGDVESAKWLTNLNDADEKTFGEIADIIEADPSMYFREPA